MPSRAETWRSSRHSALAARFALAVAVLGCLLLPSPPTASAAFYTVFPCNGKRPADLKFAIANISQSPIFNAADRCNTESPEVVLEGNNESGFPNIGDHAAWAVAAPPGTALREVAMNFDFGVRENDNAGWDTTFLTWAVYADSRNRLLERSGHTPNGQAVPVGGSVVYTAGPNDAPGKFREGTQFLLFEIECHDAFQSGGSICGSSPNVHFATSALRVVISDTSIPTMRDFNGAFRPGEVVGGTVGESFTGHDLGSGVASSEVIVSDQVASFALADDNGGKCREPFEFVAPCKLDVSLGHSIDTTRFADGSHLVRFLACDAATNCGSHELEVFFQNAPNNTTPPSISGAAKIGAQLAASPGGWDRDVVFSYQWVRCPVSVTKDAEAAKCTPIAGADKPQYTTVKADVGQREMVKVTAAVNPTAVATTSLFSAPTGVVNDVQKPPPPPPPPANPPQTLLKKHPRKKTALSLARFAFASDQAGARFECKLDKGAFRSCRSPFKKRAKHGAHVFRVRAVNGAGQVDGTPAVFHWKVL